MRVRDRESCSSETPSSVADGCAGPKGVNRATHPLARELPSDLVGSVRAAELFHRRTASGSAQIERRTDGSDQDDPAPTPKRGTLRGSSVPLRSSLAPVAQPG